MTGHVPAAEAQTFERVIPSRSDRAAYEANMAAIDRLIGQCRYPYIVAWGKFLGFTPQAVQEYVQDAEADNAPAESIQKFDDGWSVLSDIVNETNRQRVMALAKP